MAKTTAPLLSFDAGGQIAKTMVMSSWRGVRYARRYVVPSNPNTLAQQTVRGTFALMREMWKLAGPLIRAPWDLFAQGRPFTGMNKFVGENIRVLNGSPTMAPFIGSPGAKGGLPPTDLAITSPVAGEILIEADLPDLPAGWTTTGFIGFAFKQQDPSDFFQGQLLEAVDATLGADSVTITGAVTGSTYLAGVFLRQQKPDGTTAYSVALTDEILVA